MNEGGFSRRAIFLKIGIAFNGLVGAALAVPIVRYILSPITRGQRPGYEKWLSLGSIDQFPSGQTRLATYRNPGEGCLLGAQHQRRRLSSLRDQLRALGLPRALVPPVQSVHVSLPRWSLLSGRLPRVRPAGKGSV
jgi:hypothetical protein